MLSFLLSLCNVWTREVLTTFRRCMLPPSSVPKRAWSAPVHRGLAPADTQHRAWWPVRPKLTSTRTLTHPSHFVLPDGVKIRLLNVGNTAHLHSHDAVTKEHRYQHHLIIIGSYTLVPASKSGLNSIHWSFITSVLSWEVLLNPCSYSRAFRCL